MASSSDIQPLREKIRDLSSGFDVIRKETTERHKAAIQRIEKAVRSASDRSIKQQEAAFKKATAELLRDHRATLKAEEAAYRRERKRLIDELNDLLKQQAGNDRRAHPEVFRKEALDALHAMDQTPHTFFRPGVRQALDKLFRQAEKSCSDRLPQAGCAMFSSVTLQAEIQRINVEEDLQWWMRAREDLAEFLQSIRKKSDDLLSNCIPTALGDLSPDPDTLDFYAAGRLRPLLDRLQALSDVTDGLPDAVPAGTLPDACPGTPDLQKLIREADQLRISFGAIGDLIRQEIVYASERLKDSYDVLQSFDANGYDALMHGFRGNNTLDAYICTARHAEIDVTVCLLPHREHGVAVSNVAVVSVTSQLTPADAPVLTQLWRDRLSSCGMACKISAVEAQQIPTLLNTSPAPDPDAYIMHFNTVYTLNHSS